MEIAEAVDALNNYIDTSMQEEGVTHSETALIGFSQGTMMSLYVAPRRAEPIAAIVGDQQASLIGQSCVKPGRAKITFGTGGMLDLCTDSGAPTNASRHQAGTYPLPLWSRDGKITWGVEAIMLSAGTNVEWLRDDLGLIATSAESHDVASMCDATDGVVYVPALLGLGTRVDVGVPLLGEPAVAPNWLALL